jgi:CBS domain-containing protein
VAKAVRDVMTQTVHAAAVTASIVTVAQVMRDEDVGSLPVVEDGRLIGIVTDRDIVLRAVAEEVDLQTLTAGDLASHDPIAVEPGQDLDRALALMARHRIRRMPVVEDGRLVGMVAQADVALEAGEKDAGALLGEISQPRSTTGRSDTDAAKPAESRTA